MPNKSQLMRNLIFAAVLLAVAGFAYGLGRTQGGLKNRATAPLVSISPPLPDGAEGAERGKFEPSHPSDIPESKILKDAPYVQNMMSAQKGYEAAKVNLDEALKIVESLPVRERMGFITGIFSYVAKHRSPSDALKIYHQTWAPQRPNALRGLVAEWINTRSPLDEDMRYIKREGTLTISGSRLGLELELSSMLASARPDAELTAAWLDAFSHLSARSEIFSILVGQMPHDNPEAVLSRTDDWTAWEKERATKRFLASWSDENPQEAWSWYQNNRGRFEEDYSSSILAPWVASDLEGVKKLLSTVEAPEVRRSVIETIGKVMAQKNTDEAITWAEGLENSNEREVAQRAIYERAPSGIGAVLNTQNGFPTVRGIVPGGPLDGTAAKPGDQFVEVRLADGTKHALYGRDLATAVNLIRGEPGSEITLRILRQNRASGSFEEHLIPVQRGQLYLDEKVLPK
jgi:hypothetical protein